jgi:uncharacterized membrane protein
LIAVGIVLFGAGHANGNPKYLQAGFALASVSVSWIVVHTVFTLRYARLYYSGRVGGIDFNEADLPQYSDFAYLSFTIGMTFQLISVVCWRDADKRLLRTRCGQDVDKMRTTCGRPVGHAQLTCAQPWRSAVDMD